MNNKEKNFLIVSVMTMTFLKFVTPAHADLNTTELQNWLNGYSEQLDINLDGYNVDMVPTDPAFVG